MSGLHRGVRTLLAPGQGTWSDELVLPWLQHQPISARLAQWSTGVGTDLGELILDNAARSAAQVPQLAFAALGLAVAAELPPGWAQLVTGHSLGEWTAAGVAGVLPPVELLRLVALRGAATSAIADWAPTGMAAVLGGEPGEVLAALQRLRLVAANLNGRGQVVAAGPVDRLELLLADPPAGSRVRRLDVPVAFHTELLAPVSAALAQAVTTLRPTAPTVPLLSTRDGEAVTAATDVMQRLAAQTSAPIRFDRVWAALRERGVTEIVELAPAGTLSALARRELPGVRTLPLRSPADLVALCPDPAAIR